MFITYYVSFWQVSHPLLQQSYYLDEYHKARLKEEYGKYHILVSSSFILPFHYDRNAYSVLAAYSVFSDVEPWSFDQCVGEAVIVPAGCPYQNRKNKVYYFEHPTRSYLLYNRKIINPSNMTFAYFC